MLKKYVAVGQVIKQIVRNETKISKVRLQNMSLDKNLLMYFPKKKDKWAVDLKGETKVGDIVIVTKSEERMLNNMNVMIDSILYQVGETVDPVTGKRCRGTEFIDEGGRKKEQSERVEKNLKIIKVVKNAP